MALEFVEPTGFQTLNVVLYGPPGSGKTVGATSAPPPVLLVNADRPNASAMAHRLRPGKIQEVRPTAASDLEEIIQLVERGEHRSVVVGTVNDLYRVVLEDLSGRALSATLAQYRDAGTLVERFARSLCDLPVTTVIVAHELQHDAPESGDQVVVPLVGTAGPGGFARAVRLMGAVDVVAYCAHLPGGDDQPDRWVAQLAPAKGRRAKDRTGALGPVRNLDISEWVQTAQSATAPQNSNASRKEAKQ